MIVSHIALLHIKGLAMMNIPSELHLGIVICSSIER